MTPRRKQRLILVGLLLAGVGLAVGLTLTALEQNINAFYSPTEVTEGKVPNGQTFRIGGMVVENSVNRSSENLVVEFQLTDTAKNVLVKYDGILPDLFREGQGIVALGKMEDQTFIASQVLAKHDETYMPPEVSEALKKANAYQYEQQSKGTDG